MTCANNCRGVDPNSVIIGGGAVLAASGISGLAPILGLGAMDLASVAFRIPDLMEGNDFAVGSPDRSGLARHGIGAPADSVIR